MFADSEPDSVVQEKKLEWRLEYEGVKDRAARVTQTVRKWLESEAAAIAFVHATKQWVEPSETIRESGVIVEQGFSVEDCDEINAMTIEDTMMDLKALSQSLTLEGTEDE